MITRLKEFKSVEKSFAALMGMLEKLYSTETPQEHCIRAYAELEIHRKLVPSSSRPVLLVGERDEKAAAIKAYP